MFQVGDKVTIHVYSKDELESKIDLNMSSISCCNINYMRKVYHSGANVNGTIRKVDGNVSDSTDPDYMPYLVHVPGIDKAAGNIVDSNTIWLPEFVMTKSDDSKLINVGGF